MPLQWFFFPRIWLDLPAIRLMCNIGAGFWPSKQTKRRIPNTAHGALDAFIQTSPLQRLLTGTHRTGPVKGFPVRSDFTSAPTFSERIMLVGEAAGLVHTLSG